MSALAASEFRYISADGGGYRSISPLAGAGIIDVLTLGDVKNPLVFFRKLSVGYWPDRIQNGRWVGDRLLPPTADAWNDIGAYVLDSITSICDCFLEDLRDKQRAIGQEAVGKFIEEDEKFCANSPAHYGFVQREIIARIRSFAALPVDRVIFTAHEARGEEADSRIPIRGPALAGTAATDRITREVGDCIHFESYTNDVENVDPQTKVKIKRTHMRVRAFFTSHPDPRIPNVTYKCKPRVPAEMIPELLKKWPGGYFEPTLTSGLDEFLRFEDELLAWSSDRERQWKQEVDANLKSLRSNN